jgi:glycerophosphoryl diester phosphodiesterase
MIILAHRGWWLEPAEKNSRLALTRAFEAGYGVETDLRDLNGEVVVSHDPPTGEGHMTMLELLTLFKQAGEPGGLALNIKADGLQKPLAQALAQTGVTNYFVFDMSVPDGLVYLRHGLTAFTRRSEHEAAPSFLDRAAGIWVDAFDGDWVTGADLTALSQGGKALALVSPELHGRPHKDVWSRWRRVTTNAQGPLMLCTDFPDAADAVFNDDDSR